MDTDTSTGSNHRDPLTRHNTRPFARDMVGRSYRVGDYASFA
jgi:hypothetical protein